MNKTKSQVDRIKIGLMTGLLTVLTGCAGLGGGGYYGGVMVSEPDQFLFGGDYDRGPNVQNYSRRGSESRGTASHAGSSGHVTTHVSGTRGARR